MELTFSNWGALNGAQASGRRRSFRRMAHAYDQVIDLKYVDPKEAPAPDPMAYDRAGHPAPLLSRPGGILNTRA